MSVRGIKRAHIFCSSLAFYDFEPILGDRAKQWLNYCVSTTENLGHPFDEGSCIPGNSKYVLLRNFKRAFEKNINQINSVELRTSAKSDIGAYGEVFASMDNDDRSGSIGIHRDFISLNELRRIGMKVCEMMRPKYGFFYEIPFVYSPYFYVTGAMGLGELDTYEHSKFYNPKHVDFEKRAVAWAIANEKSDDSVIVDSYDACSDGHLREVYPINFINKNHLDYEVFPKITLKDWIEGQDHRGSLQQITEELWMWAIDDADLEDVTVALAPSDILLCVNKEDPHRYDYGVRVEDQIRPESWDYWREVARREREENERK